MTFEMNPQLASQWTSAQNHDAERLLLAAREAAGRAYAPFSRFHVGAALLMADDAAQHVFTGANVENSSYGLTLCAERSAIVTAVSAGFRRLRLIAVTCASTVTGAPLCDRSPCGACRQVIREFADEHTRIIIDGAHTLITPPRVVTMEELLPWGFCFGGSGE
jgi:cytidine deaminase